MNMLISLATITSLSCKRQDSDLRQSVKVVISTWKWARLDSRLA